jgi:hypothetical protein
MGFFSDHKWLPALFPAIILWGCFGGFCFAAASFYLHSLEEIVYISCYSGIVSQIYPFWKFGTLIILLFNIGMVAAELFCTGRKTGLDPIRTGLVSGTCTALVAFILVEVIPLGFTWINHPVYMAGTLIQVLIVYILIITIPQALGAWYQGSRQTFGQEQDDTTPTAITSKRYRPWLIFVAFLVLILILPLGLLALPLDTTDYSACPEGQTLHPGDQCGYGRPPDNVTVSRAGPDSIRVSLKAGSSICGSQNSFKILLNGNDVSNQALIAKSGHDVTISPREGLGRQDGSFVILQGKDLVVNETPPPHIQIIITDRSTTWIHRDLYL